MSPARSNLAAGVLALIAIGIGVMFGFGFRLPSHHYRMTADFRDAHDIKLGSPVRIAGVRVGKVVALHSLAGGAETGRATIQLDDQALPIHRDARLALRPRIFLEGNYFLQLDAGSPSAPELPDGGALPVSQTSSFVSFTQVTGALTHPVRADLRTVLQELDSALSGAGAAGFNASIPYWEPAYRDGALVADAFRGDDDDLSGFIRNGGRAAAALDRDPQALRDLITNLRATATAFARESESLNQALAEAPRLLEVARPALASINASLPSVRAFARDARPGIRALGPALGDALPLTRQISGLLQPAELGGLARDLQRTLPALARGAHASLPLLRELRLGSSCAATVVGPTLHDHVTDAQFPATGPVYEEFPKSLPGIAGESRPFDANAPWIRALLLGGNYAYPQAADQVLLSARPIEGVNPPLPTRGIPPFRPDVPCETQQTPDLRSVAGAAPEGFKVNQTSSAAQALTARGLEPATRWVRKLLRRGGLQEPVRSTPLQPSELSRVSGRIR